MKIAMIILVFLSLNSNAQAANIECSATSSQIEKVICTDELLNKADEQMSAYYSKLEGALSSADLNELYIEQKLWLMKREILCPGVYSICLMNSYGKRMKELNTKYGHLSPLSPSEASAVQGARTVCAFPEVILPSDLKIYGAGNYAGGTFDKRIDSSGHQATAFDVVVNSPSQPVALILGAYDPAVWNISWTEGTKIVAVAVTGYHRQIVIGVTPETPLLISRGSPCESSYIIWGNIDALNRLSEKLFHRPTDAINLSSNGRSVLGSPLAAGVPLIKSKATSIEDFVDTELPLSGSAALAQAILEGSIRKSNGEERKEWRRRWIEAHTEATSQKANNTSHPMSSDSNTYVILKQYLIPKGLSAAGSPIFYLPTGVPYPKGNIEESALYDFGTLKCHGWLCDWPCIRCGEQ